MLTAEFRFKAKMKYLYIVCSFLKTDTTMKYFYHGKEARDGESLARSKAESPKGCEHEANNNTQKTRKVLR